MSQNGCECECVRECTRVYESVQQLLLNSVMHILKQMGWSTLAPFLSHLSFITQFGFRLDFHLVFHVSVFSGRESRLPRAGPGQSVSVQSPKRSEICVRNSLSWTCQAFTIMVSGSLMYLLVFGQSHPRDITSDHTSHRHMQI